MVVDEVSLIKDGPIRVKVMAREISKLQGFVEFFIAGVGYEVKVTPESSFPKKFAANPPPPPKKPDDDYQEDEEDDLYDTDDELPQRSAKQGNHQSAKNSGMEGREGSTGKHHTILDQEAVESSLEAGGGSDLVADHPKSASTALDALPIAIFDPSTELLLQLQHTQEENLSQLVNAEQEHSGEKPSESEFFVVHTEGVVPDSCTRTSGLS